MKTWIRIFLATFLALSVYGGIAFAQPVTMQEARIVTENWIRVIVQKKGARGTAETAEIGDIQEFTRKGRFFRVLLPVIAYRLHHRFPAQGNGSGQGILGKKQSRP